MKITLILAEIFTKPHAYLDPGTGSLLIQLLLAGLLGVGVAIKIFWKNIKGFFGIDDSEVLDESDPTALDEDSD
jgi:hypothetical protein